MLEEKGIKVLSDKNKPVFIRKDSLK